MQGSQRPAEGYISYSSTTILVLRGKQT